MALISAPVVVVTGCSEGGIGYSLCEAFTAQGCRVFATARRPEAMEGLKEQGIETVRLDVTSSASIKEAVQHIVTQAGRIDILVNNAGRSLNQGQIWRVPPLGFRKQHTQLMLDICNHPAEPCTWCSPQSHLAEKPAGDCLAAEQAHFVSGF